LPAHNTEQRRTSLLEHPQGRKEGLVLAIEPMINRGTKNVYTEEDGWKVRTSDHKPSVHFEHDVCVKKNKADILSDFSIIENEEKSNSYLFSNY